MQTGLARTNMYSHAGQILELLFTRLGEGLNRSWRTREMSRPRQPHPPVSRATLKDIFKVSEVVCVSSRYEPVGDGYTTYTGSHLIGL